MKELTLNKIILKAEDYLESSKSSFRNEFFNAAVNGAYYTIYHAVQALLFVSESNTKTHNGAHAKFRELYIKTGILDKTLNTCLQRSFEKDNLATTIMMKFFWKTQRSLSMMLNFS